MFQLFKTNAKTTMSSTEIAELTGKEKKNVHRDIRVQILEGLYDIKDGTDMIHVKIQGLTAELDNRGYVSEYHLDKEHTLTLISGYNVKMRHAINKRWIELETATFAPPPSTLSLADSLAGMEVLSRMLNMSASSTLMLASGVVKVKAPELLHLVPVYAIDAPNSTDTSSQLTFSATKLLEMHGKPMTVQKFNIIAVERGYLTEESRPSTTKGFKQFKCLTDKGLQFGKNMTSPQNPRETAPHYYADKFEELLTLLR